MAKRNYVYDIETYPNFFCAIFKCGSVVHTFEISDRINDLNRFVQFYNDTYIKYAIGFNNVRFDAQVLEWILKDYEDLSVLHPNKITDYIFRKAQDTIRRSNDREMMPFFESRMKVKQLDIFLMLGYNGKAKATSLKWVEYSINYKKVQDLPLKFDRYVEKDQYDNILKYCLNDVSATEQFVSTKDSTSLIKLRIAQQEQYPMLSLLNKSDSTVGETLFLYEMSKEMDIPMKDLRKMRTPRQPMLMKDLILPYIKFDIPEFQDVLEKFQKSFSNNFEHRMVYKGLETVFGVGGIHASWENRIFESDDEFIIKDLDVNL